MTKNILPTYKHSYFKLLIAIVSNLFLKSKCNNQIIVIKVEIKIQLFFILQC